VSYSIRRSSARAAIVLGLLVAIPLTGCQGEAPKPAESKGGGPESVVPTPPLKNPKSNAKLDVQ